MKKKKKRIYKYLKDQIADGARNLKIMKKNFDMDAIHDMRVATKKMRAVLRFLEFINSGFKAKKQLKPIKKIYKAAGKIRDTQVQQELAESYEITMNESFEELIHYLERKEVRYQENYSAELADTSIDRIKKRQKKVKKKISKISNKKAGKQEDVFLFHGMQKINELLKNTDDPENLHDIRKILKDLNYVMQLDKKKHKNPETNTPLDKDAVSKIGSALGKWHDRFVAQEFVDEFLEKNSKLAQNKVKKYEKYHRRLMADNKVLLAEVEYDIQQLLADIKEKYPDKMKQHS